MTQKATSKKFFQGNNEDDDNDEVFFEQVEDQTMDNNRFTIAYALGRMKTNEDYEEGGFIKLQSL